MREIDYALGAPVSKFFLAAGGGFGLLCAAMVMSGG